MFSRHSVNEAKVGLSGRAATPGGMEETYYSLASGRQVQPTWVSYRRMVTSVEMLLPGCATPAHLPGRVRVQQTQENDNRQGNGCEMSHTTIFV